MMTAYINFGHSANGIPDTGACNDQTGLRECDVAKTIGEKLIEYLNNAGVNVLGSIQSDSLAEICEEANSSGADIFVSIHCNAFNGVAQGTEVCSPTDNECENLAQCIQDQIVNSLGTVDRGVKIRDGLYVLRHTTMVAVLVETAFIDNPDDEKLLSEKPDEFAAAIARGITDYEQKYFNK